MVQISGKKRTEETRRKRSVAELKLSFVGSRGANQFGVCLFRCCCCCGLLTLTHSHSLHAIQLSAKEFGRVK